MSSSVSDLISIATYRSTADVQIAKGILDEVGIDSIISADNQGGTYRSELLVRNEDFHEAGEALHRRHRWPTEYARNAQQQPQRVRLISTH